MKYDIDDSFSLMRNFSFGFNPFLIRLAKPFLSILPNGMKSNRKLSIKKIRIPTRDKKSICAYIIYPKTSLKGVIFNFHGGAFVYKAIRYQYTMAKAYAEKSGYAVVFPDYRLSYCSAFNTPLYDCEDTYQYVLKNATELGLNVSKIGVMGDSAGGYLSLLTCKFAHENALPTPAFQLLVYPVVDPDMRTKSMQDFTDTPMWNSILNKKMWDTYLKGNSVTSPLDEDLAYMPPTFIETAQFDCLRDEGILLYEKLISLGISCTLSQTHATMHGFDFISCPITTHAVAKRIHFLTHSVH